MIRVLVFMVVCFPSFIALAGSPGGLTTVIIPFTSAEEYKSLVERYFKDYLDGGRPIYCANAEGNSETLTIGNYFINKTLDETLMKSALVNQRSLNRLQKKLLNYRSAAAPQGFDALLTYEVSGNYLIFYGISSDAAEPARKAALYNKDIHDPRALGQAICRVLAAFPVYYDE
ncbi:hypothetical protein [Intestinirhabdus alba]|jgi:hypothetical protein|uniref:Uncharacterized protein n=1 Tax=Intestinirhabdus alba TaxID=2899544 RepID=A0A6L6IQK9_9ENTR|nr:hypothetical protein [Intestinirhabdus alba]MTH48217.1 hypothetical protein [Intestinirhabdus alba]